LTNSVIKHSSQNSNITGNILLDKIALIKVEFLNKGGFLTLKIERRGLR